MTQGSRCPGTRQYKLVRTSATQYELRWIQGGTRNVKIVHTSTYLYVPANVIMISSHGMKVHTGMYRYVLHGTRRYKEVQGGTSKYKVVQGTVPGGTRQYVLVCTGMYSSLRFNSDQVMLPCGWIRSGCCNSAWLIALYWRPVHLMTAMQAQACFNKPLVLPLITPWSCP